MERRDFLEQLEALRGDPAGLERLHRALQEAGSEEAFADAVRRCAERHPEDALLASWTYRLDLRSPYPQPLPGTGGPPRAFPRWTVALPIAAVLGVLFAVLADGGPPVPAPDEAATAFWIGWGPLTALGILLYLAIGQPSRILYFGSAAAVIAVLTAATAALAGGRADDVAALVAVHLPFSAWAVVGAALCLAHPDPARQGYAYLVKSAETLLTAGIYLGAGALFVVLSFGIVAVLGIEIPERYIQTAITWVLGAVPLLALASVYDGSRMPVAQDWRTGLAGTLRLLTRLLLPSAIAVLLVYVLWFIPAYFTRGFEEREVLAIYNATILAILALLALVVSGPPTEPLPRYERLLHRGVLLLGGLALVLNLYALAAIVVRIVEGGWTPNRVAVLGWNGTTLLMLGLVGVALWRHRDQPWRAVFRAWTARAVVLAAVWSVGVVLVLPLWFR